MIELKDVYKRLDGRDVLAGLSLEIEKGETVVILGRSGTGKSVTLRHIVGLMRPDRGSVRVLDTEVSTASAAELEKLRARIGYLFQDGALLNWLTVEENVALPLRERRRRGRSREIIERARECLSYVELLEAGKKVPGEISGGMRKRAGLARALVTKPEVVLYDEPTSGLDPISSNIINDLIISLREKLQITQVVVTHDMSSAYRIADRMALLHGGKVVAVGTPAEFQKSTDPAIVQFVNGDVEGPLAAQPGSGEDTAAHKRSRKPGEDGA